MTLTEAMGESVGESMGESVGESVGEAMGEAACLQRFAFVPRRLFDNCLTMFDNLCRLPYCFGGESVGESVGEAACSGFYLRPPATV